ncbi:DNA-binding transcriptional repressor MarR [Actinomadura rubteroloni]|uniref:DNA-binding transcriptional repressor MarR n=1 Tax=Actinomadura rubteroloni TaxID=1926885 RepID=A0A2P4UL38_9ACTN|nr:DNA-binding transcriptional repressor MarR [Actinomadura rubteroloni]
MRPSFTGETLTGELARGRFPGIRKAMLDFVGAYLLDFETSAQRAGLTLAQARVLGFAAIKPSSMKELAEQFGCDPSNLTAKVDRLVALGLVERRTDPHDGRVKLIAATPEGVATSAALCHSRDWLAEVLGSLTPDEAQTIQTAFDLLVNRAPA